MRDARSGDYWRTAYNREYPDSLLEVDFSLLNSLPKLTLSAGVLVLCGLNGAGKSTIISAIKDLIGLPLSQQDIQRIGTYVISGKATAQGKEITCSNQEGDRLADKGWNLEQVIYLDCAGSAASQQFILTQSNLNELLEQYEEYEFTDDEIEEINYLVGKRYTHCFVRELSDVAEQDSNIPYFCVEIDGEKYDTKGMGHGEHFLLYLFWHINNVSKDTLIVIEEPETYVSISSQIHFINFLGKQMAKKRVKVILTTHSPYILSNIKDDNICVVSRVGNNASIIKPSESLPAEILLGLEGEDKGTFFVEDRVAADFLQIILEDRLPHMLRSYTIESVGGASEISSRLSFPKSDKIKYNFIGIYDGDMRNRLDPSKLNWSFCFLPGEKGLEEYLRELLHHQENIKKLCGYLNKEEGQIIAMLSGIDGLDCHDWFLEFRKLLSIEGRTLIAAFYHTMVKDEKSIDEFIDEIIDVVSM